MKINRMVPILVVSLLVLSSFFISAYLKVHTGARSHPTKEAAVRPVLPDPIIKVTAKRFEYSPREIVLTKGVTTELDLTSLDVHHGFNCPDLGLRADILPGEVTVLKVRPSEAGSYDFFCDVYCGLGHGGMHGTITVNEPGSAP